MCRGLDKQCFSSGRIYRRGRDGNIGANHVGLSLERASLRLWRHVYLLVYARNPDGELLVKTGSHKAM